MFINLGLIGNPVFHTLSPVIHNSFFYNSGLCGGYTTYNVHINDLSNLIDHFKKYNFLGVNVTVPYKQEVIKYCDELDESAETIGACNTLKFTNNKIIGYNTDIYGFEKLMDLSNVSINNKSVLLLGAGGASRAIIPYLNKHNPKEVTFANRTIDSALNLSKLYMNNSNVSNLEEINLKKYNVVINSTSIGVDGSSFPDFGFKVDEMAVDLIYKPINTPFLSLYKNIVTVNGLNMLIYQAAKSFSIWTEKEITPDIEYLKKIIYH